jgi:hypothetical protein
MKKTCSKNLVTLYKAKPLTDSGKGMVMQVKQNVQILFNGIIFVQAFKQFFLNLRMCACGF